MILLYVESKKNKAKPKAWGGTDPDPADPTRPVQQRPEMGEDSRERSRPTPGG